MNFVKILCLLALSFSVLGADEPRKDPQPAKIEPSDENADWLIAIDRLRTLPRPGETKYSTFKAQLSDIYSLSKEQQSKFAELRAAYDAELLKRAAKWQEEQKSLRDEYNAQVLALVPDDRRDAARKLLDFTHQSWSSPLEREEKFKKEYADRAFKLQQARATMSVEELNQARDEMRAWVKDMRAKFMKQDEETLAKIRDMLAPEEQARLSKSKQ